MTEDLENKWHVLSRLLLPLNANSKVTKSVYSITQHDTN
jgi:hypothetical protein